MLKQTSTERGESPGTSYVVCTRDRTDQLTRCLTSIQCQIKGEDEIIVVDNSPLGSARRIAEELGAAWIGESRPGSGWARNTGLHAASHGIVVFIDDDCVADGRWASQMCRPLLDPTVDAVTGSVIARRPDLAVPYLIDSDYSFHRGWLPMRYVGSTGSPWSPLDIWRVGVGGTMAWRKSTLLGIGGFDPALGAGTPAGSCEDIDAFRRLLQAHGTICYQPTALVWHDHPESIDDLRAMMIRYAITLGAHAAKMALEERNWRAISFLVHDWRWQLGWAMQLLLGRSEGNLPVQMPVGGLLLQPGASVLGMWRFVRFRQQLREGRIPGARPSKRRQRSSSTPLRSGVAYEELEIAGGFVDRVFADRTIVLLRSAGLPVGSVEVPSGKRLNDVLQGYHHCEMAPQVPLDNVAPEMS